MAISLIWVYVVYMFSPQQEAGENTEEIDINTWVVENMEWEIVEVTGENQIVLPEVNPDEPENTAAPILVTEDGEINEMDQTFEVQLENGETEIVRQWDLWDAIQIN